MHFGAISDIYTTKR